MSDEYIGKTILSRDLAAKGKVISASRRCQMDGCCGTRLGVRWENGKLTYPCSRGIETAPTGEMKIG